MNRPVSLRTDEKSARGESKGASALELPERGRDLGGENPKEASVGHLANPQGPGRDFCGVSNPEVGPRAFRRSKINHRRGAAFERAYGDAKGAKPRRANPMGGFEMK